MLKDEVFLLKLENYDIHDQLLLEEALLRSTTKNWCILNRGSSPKIVMGISGKPAQLLDLKKWETAPLPVIKRYSGGGTVVVDENTLFVSFIFQKNSLGVSPFPEPILRWSETFYKSALSIPNFSLRENDYVIENKKCGGNAQYLKKERIVHHTTFLWDFEKEKMAYLSYPPKTPQYRMGRAHESFLCCLKEHFASQEIFFQKIEAALHQKYLLKQVFLDEVLPFLACEHRISTSRIF